MSNDKNVWTVLLEVEKMLKELVGFARRIQGETVEVPPTDAERLLQLKTMTASAEYWASEYGTEHQKVLKLERALKQAQTEDRARWQRHGESCYEQNQALERAELRIRELEGRK